MVKIVLKANESARVRHAGLRKILDKAGIRRELREGERYRKPSAVKHEAKNRAIRRTHQQ